MFTSTTNYCGDVCYHIGPCHRPAPYRWDWHFYRPCHCHCHCTHWCSCCGRSVPFAVSMSRDEALREEGRRQERAKRRHRPMVDITPALPQRLRW